jgi:hypothetical protein
MKKLLVLAIAFIGCGQTLQAAKIVNKVGYQIKAINNANNKQSTIDSRKSMTVKKGETYTLVTNTNEGVTVRGTFTISEDKDYNIATNKDASDQFFWIEVNGQRI